MVKGPAAGPSANAIFVRSGDQLGWRCCCASPVASGPLVEPPPVLLMTLRRKSCVLPKAGPSMKTIRPFVPESTAPAGAGTAKRAMRASPIASGLSTAVNLTGPAERSHPYFGDVDGLDVGLLAGVVRRRGRGAGLLLERGDPVAVLARLALDRPCPARGGWRAARSW